MRILLPFVILNLAFFTGWWISYNQPDLVESSENFVIEQFHNLQGAFKQKNAADPNSNSAQQASPKQEVSAISQKQSHKASKVRPLVEIDTYKAQTWKLPVELGGIVTPESKVSLFSEAEGTLVSINPKIAAGKIVEKGEELYRIDSPALNNQLLAAQSKVHQAEQALLQTKAQVNTAGEVPGLKTPLHFRQQMLKTQTALLQTAKADLRLAQAYFDRQSIKAPFTARVVDKGLSMGQMLVAGTEMASVFQPESMIVELGLNGENAELLKSNHVNQDNLQIRISWLRGSKVDSFTGRLLSRSGSIDPLTGLESVKIEVSQNNQQDQDTFLLPGERVEVLLGVPTDAELLRLPLALASQNQVYTIKNKRRSDSDLLIAEVERLRLNRVFSDKDFAYFTPSSQTQIQVIETPPTWLLPGHEVRFTEPDRTYSQQEHNTSLAVRQE